jgi:hypothetical protein
MPLIDRKRPAILQKLIKSESLSPEKILEESIRAGFPLRRAGRIS